MARLNQRSTARKGQTHEGAKVFIPNAEEQLRRSVMACLLWENTFYESGESIADRIVKLAMSLPANKVAQISIEARHQQHLRHVPLLLLSVIAKTGAGTSLVSETMEKVISRADELTEFLAIYWKDGKTPLSAQVKKGLAAAFVKFDAYQLGKYNRDGAIKLRDVLFLVHPKTNDAEQQAAWDKLAAGTLESPDTWEVALSGGADKKQTFERMINEGRLGYMALIRNLRNMDQAGVDAKLVRDAIRARKGAHNVLPFRFVAAAKEAPMFSSALDDALVASVSESPQLSGDTIVVVDVSGSMGAVISAKSKMNRIEVAAALAGCINSENVRHVIYGTECKEIEAFKGLAAVKNIIGRGNEVGWGTDLGRCMNFVNKMGAHDRVIVITDEQSRSRIPNAIAKNAYIINVAAYQNGIAYDQNYVHINGWSDNVIRFITEYEAAQG